MKANCFAVYALIAVNLTLGTTWAKKKETISIDPSQFTLSARVTGYSLRQSTIAVGSTSTRPSFCDTQNESWQKSYCAAAGNHSHNDNRKVRTYVLTAEIEEAVYDLEGHSRLEPGTYQVRMQGERVEFLRTKDNGELFVMSFHIVGKHLRDADKP